MGSEAKIGLLIGLVIVFVIAFVLNGLSRFGDARESDPPPKLADSDPLGIIPEIPAEVFPPARVPERPPKETPPPEGKQQFRVQLPGKTSPRKTDNPVEPVKQAWPKVHVVRKGDNLADIAKRYYGPKEGNRIANIKRIFEVNHKALKSPDKIYPGQKLIIPSLWASEPDRNRTESIFPESMFEKVESIGRRHI
ncbi:MAG: LysM peptidoglycan-binding domain-containing protein [Phycisphaerales bacterium]|jgi:nucleoid-associated protein YgaU